MKQVGNTPIVKYENLYFKLENQNPTGSIKDRAAYNILKSLLKEKAIKKGDTVVISTSGNIGIAIAYFGKELGLKVIVTMPSNMSVERINLLKKYDAEVILTDATLGMKGANELAFKISKENNYFEINQFTSIYNQEAHFETMKEILKDLSDVDYIICGIGSAGTISGLSRYIKEHNLNIKVIGIEPEESAIITKGIKGEHAIQGIGAGFIPPLLNLENIYKIVCVKSQDVLKEFKNKKEISLGLSSCACYLVGKDLLIKEPDKKILIIVADGADRYGGVN